MEKRGFKGYIPRSVWRDLRDLLGLSSKQAGTSEFEDLLSQSRDSCSEVQNTFAVSKEGLWEKSRERWRGNEPHVGLTWNRDLTGHNFIAKADSYNAFDGDRNVLEIGPGYGRLLKAMLLNGVPFKSYLGVELSEARTHYLKETFSNEKIDFANLDIEKAALGRGFDVVISSLTFKHLYPTFEKALSNVATQMNPGGMFLFDLLEGKESYFEDDTVTYIRFYLRSEVLEILGRTGLKLVAFDQVEHDPEHSRLLVVAKLGVCEK